MMFTQRRRRADPGLKTRVTRVPRKPAPAAMFHAQGAASPTSMRRKLVRALFALSCCCSLLVTPVAPVACSRVTRRWRRCARRWGGPAAHRPGLQDRANYRRRLRHGSTGGAGTPALQVFGALIGVLVEPAIGAGIFALAASSATWAADEGGHGQRHPDIAGRDRDSGVLALISGSRGQAGWPPLSGTATRWTSTSTWSPGLHSGWAAHEGSGRLGDPPHSILPVIALARSLPWSSGPPAVAPRV